MTVPTFKTLPLGLDHAEIAASLSSSGQEYLQHAQTHLAASVTSSSVASTPLDIAIVGGGICGLSSAIALRHTGHRVTVFEATEKIGTIGAGIQLAPNATRQLRRWGLAEHLERICVHPKHLMTKRWADGKPLGLFRTRDLLKQVGSPFIQVHRGDLHEGLHDLAVKLGVVIRPGCKVVGYKHEAGSLTLNSDETLTADLIIAADGVRSIARSEIEDAEATGSAKWVAYRSNIPTATVQTDPKLAWMVQDPHQNCWAGPDHHCQVYSMRSNDLLNMVFIAPMNDTRDPTKYKDEILEHFGSWDPELARLLSMIDPGNVGKWPVWTALHPARWSKPNGKVTLLGDAAHDMTPFLGQGAAMAIEDSACIEQLLLAVRSGGSGQKESDVLAALEILEAFRGHRTGQIRRQAEANVELWHLPDGKEQVDRDTASAVELLGDDYADSPYIFADREGQKWFYAYDIVKVIRGES